MTEDFFNLEKNPKKKGKKDITLSIAVIALVVILVFGFVIFTEYDAKEMLSSASDRVARDVERAFIGDETEEDEEAVEEEAVEEEEEVFEKNYTQTAQKGDGLTHLARRALTSYIEEEDLDLCPEKRIFIEDYIQRTLQGERGTDLVEVEEEVEISPELLEEAVEEAENLTAEELENLKQYSALVSF